MSKSLKPRILMKQRLDSSYAANSAREDSQNNENQKFRDCSIYNKNLSLQIMKEQMFKNREIELRR